LGGVAVSQLLLQGIAHAQAAAGHGNVLAAGEGEHLIHFRDGGNIFIKAGPASGSENLAFGTQLHADGCRSEGTGKVTRKH